MYYLLLIKSCQLYVLSEPKRSVQKDQKKPLKIIQGIKLHFTIRNHFVAVEERFLL